MTDASPDPLPYLIGVISDTHGTLPDAAYMALQGVDAIIHAGDIGEGFVLDVLETIAPVTLVRGNNRYAIEADRPLVANVVLGGVRFVVVHRRQDVPPALARTRVVVTGHTHVGRVEDDGTTLLVNPGSPVAPRRGSARSVALIEVRAGGTVAARLVPLG